MTLRPTTRRLAIALVALSGSAAVASCGVGGGGAPSPTSYHWTGAAVVHPLAKPEFKLTDQAGQPFDFKQDTKGKVTLLYFGYTHCPDVCPANMSMLAVAMKQLPASVRSKIAVVFVTTDPERDTPAALAAWLGTFNSGFVGLTGPKASVDIAQAEAHVSLASPEPANQSGTYYVDHAAQIMCYTPDDIAHLMFFEGMPSSGVARDLQRLVSKGWTGS